MATDSILSMTGALVKHSVAALPNLLHRPIVSSSRRQEFAVELPSLSQLPNAIPGRGRVRNSRACERLRSPTEQRIPLRATTVSRQAASEANLGFEEKHPLLREVSVPVHSRPLRRNPDD